MGTVSLTLRNMAIHRAINRQISFIAPLILHKLIIVYRVMIIDSRSPFKAIL